MSRIYWCYILMRKRNQKSTGNNWLDLHFSFLNLTFKEVTLLNRRTFSKFSIPSNNLILSISRMRFLVTTDKQIYCRVLRICPTDIHTSDIEALQLIAPLLQSSSKLFPRIGIGKTEGIWKQIERENVKQRSEKKTTKLKFHQLEMYCIIIICNPNIAQSSTEKTFSETLFRLFNYSWHRLWKWTNNTPDLLANNRCERMSENSVSQLFIIVPGLNSTCCTPCILSWKIFHGLMYDVKPFHSRAILRCYSFGT